MMRTYITLGLGVCGAIGIGGGGETGGCLSELFLKLQNETTEVG